MEWSQEYFQDLCDASVPLPSVCRSQLNSANTDRDTALQALICLGLYGCYDDVEQALIENKELLNHSSDDELINELIFLAKRLIPLFRLEEQILRQTNPENINLKTLSPNLLFVESTLDDLNLDGTRNSEWIKEFIWDDEDSYPSIRIYLLDNALFLWIGTLFRITFRKGDPRKNVRCLDFACQRFMQTLVEKQVLLEPYLTPIAKLLWLRCQLARCMYQDLGQDLGEDKDLKKLGFDMSADQRRNFVLKIAAMRLEENHEESGLESEPWSAMVLPWLEWRAKDWPNISECSNWRGAWEWLRSMGQELVSSSTSPGRLLLAQWLLRRMRGWFFLQALHQARTSEDQRNLLRAERCYLVALNMMLTLANLTTLAEEMEFWCKDLDEEGLPSLDALKKGLARQHNSKSSDWSSLGKNEQHVMLLPPFQHPYRQELNNGYWYIIRLGKEVCELYQLKYKGLPNDREPEDLWAFAERFFGEKEALTMLFSSHQDWKLSKASNLIAPAQDVLHLLICKINKCKGSNRHLYIGSGDKQSLILRSLLLVPLELGWADIPWYTAFCDALYKHHHEYYNNLGQHIPNAFLDGFSFEMLFAWSQRADLLRRRSPSPQSDLELSLSSLEDYEAIASEKQLYFVGTHGNKKTFDLEDTGPQILFEVSNNALHSLPRLPRLEELPQLQQLMELNELLLAKSVRTLFLNVCLAGRSFGLICGGRYQTLQGKIPYDSYAASWLLVEGLCHVIAGSRKWTVPYTVEDEKHIPNIEWLLWLENNLQNANNLQEKGSGQVLVRAFGLACLGKKSPLLHALWELSANKEILDALKKLAKEVNPISLGIPEPFG